MQTLSLRLSHLPLNALRAFVVAAQLGSFRAAAQVLSVTPSAISHAVKKLEETVDAPLFERRGRAIALTQTGQTLLHHIRIGFDEIHFGLDHVTGQARNVLRIHSSPSIAVQWLMPRISRFKATHPDIHIQLAANSDPPRLLTDEVDLSINYGPGKPEGHRVYALGEETVTPLCAPEVAARIRHPADLYALSLIDSQNSRMRWDAWFALNDMRIPVSYNMQFDRSFLSLTAAKDGLGVALESTRLAEREIAAGTLLAPLSGKSMDLVYIGHYLIVSRRAEKRPAAATFVQWLDAEVGVFSVRGA